MHEILEQGGQHLLLLLSIIVAFIGIRKWMRAEMERRDALLVESANQTALLKRIDRELHPENGDRGGPTALDVLNAGIERNTRAIAEMHADNTNAHEEIHRRIDGFFEAIGIQNGQWRNMVDRHKAEREERG